jgi:hypothetical protein
VKKHTSFAKIFGNTLKVLVIYASTMLEDLSVNLRKLAFISMQLYVCRAFYCE